MSDIRHLDCPRGRRLAYRHLPGSGPALVFLPGYMSDMAGGKATALLGWAQAQGRECLLLDYAGCGQSGGLFAEQTIGGWRDDVLALAAALTSGPVVLVGSSLGGWIMLLAGQVLAAEGRLAGLVGIAAAPDFTEWGTSEAQKAELRAGRTVWEDNPYGPEPTPTHALLWADGQALRVLDGGAIAVDCPVRLLHGQADPDVPWELALQIAARVRSADVQVTLIKDGDHRLSRDGDIALLLRTIAALT